jgi:1-acyl-sn-glycerol-3-phosphate acyltransferase
VTAVPALGGEVPRRGSRAVVLLGRLMLRAIGWRIEGEIPNLRKFVIAVAPHTSNWDFIVGMAAMFALDLRLSFIGKHTLFGGPLAPFLRWMGGIPVDRSSPHGVVGDSVRAFESVERRVLAIAPQGTRKPVPRFKSGFLHIARGARVPILLAGLDYATRTVRLGPLVQPGEDVEAERERIEGWFKGVRGKRR